MLPETNVHYEIQTKLKTEDDGQWCKATETCYLRSQVQAVLDRYSARFIESEYRALKVTVTHEETEL